MRRAWILMLATLVAVGSVAGCLLTSSFDGLTGGKVPPDGGTGGTPTTASSSASGTGGATTTASSAATTSSAGGAGGATTASSTTATSSSSAVSSSSSSSGAPFPSLSTSILDNFNRADGPLGGSWLAQTPGTYTIAADQLSVPMGDSGTLIWPTVFGATQEAFITIETISSGNFEFELLLKNQSGVTECEAMQVTYHYPSITLYTCSSGNGAQIGNPVTVLLGSGDQFGARAYPDGTVEAFKNGALVGTWDASSFPAHASGGRIGFETQGITTAVQFDDFGGG